MDAAEVRRGGGVGDGRRPQPSAVYSRQSVLVTPKSCQSIIITVPEFDGANCSVDKDTCEINKSQLGGPLPIAT